MKWSVDWKRYFAVWQTVFCPSWERERHTKPARTHAQTFGTPKLWASLISRCSHERLSSGCCVTGFPEEEIFPSTSRNWTWLKTIVPAKVRKCHFLQQSYFQEAFLGASACRCPWCPKHEAQTLTTNYKGKGSAKSMIFAFSEPRGML